MMLFPINSPLTEHVLVENSYSTAKLQNSQCCGPGAYGGHGCYPASPERRGPHIASLEREQSKAEIGVIFNTHPLCTTGNLIGPTLEIMCIVSCVTWTRSKSGCFVCLFTN